MHGDLIHAPVCLNRNFPWKSVLIRLDVLPDPVEISDFMIKLKRRTHDFQASSSSLQDEMRVENSDGFQI